MTTNQIQRTADVVCVRSDGFVLLIVRGDPPFKGKLALPGGYLNTGEAPEAAGARELQEETGVVAAPGSLIKINEYGSAGRDPRGDFRTTAYLLQVPTDTAAVADDDAAEVRWVPIDQAVGLAFDHDQIVADARKILARL